MFETSVIRAQVRPARSRYAVLVTSVIAHSAVVIGTVAVSIASTEFPGTAPREYQRAPLIAVVQIPPPLGHPNGGAQPHNAQPQQPQRPPTPNVATAPPVIPDHVQTTAESTPLTGTGTDTNPNGTVPGPIGVEDGTPDSPGSLDAVPLVNATPVAPVDKIYQPGEVVAPVLVQKVDPRYPSSLSRTGVSATVVVRCVIDKNGNVRDAEVMVPAMPPFNVEVLRVVSQWKYKPATYAGRAVDSYLNLTVHFDVRR
jgi:TonB family protein